MSDDTNLVWDEEKQEFINPDDNQEVDRPEWVPDDEATACKTCLAEFTFLRRRHHCRGCGQVFCNECTNYRVELPKTYDYTGKQRVCLHCYTWASDQVKQGGAKGSVVEGIRCARFYIRDFPDYVFKETMDHLGRRPSEQKCHCQVEHVVGVNKQNEIITVTTPSDSALEFPSETGIRFFRYILKTIDHPYIQPVVKSDYHAERNKALVFREWRYRGSVKDLIYRTNAKNTYDKKYGPGRSGKALSLEAVALYGRQILEALHYLDRLGFCFPHLTSANVLVSDDKRWCMLSDLENTLCGLDPYYYLESKLASPEVEAFGNVLFEMSMGQERPTSEPNDFLDSAPPIPDTAPKGVREVLKAIFEPGTAAPPTIEELLDFAIFAEVPLAPDTSKVPKLKSKARFLLDSIREQQMGRIGARIELVEERRGNAQDQRKAEEEAAQRKATGKGPVKRKGRRPAGSAQKRKSAAARSGGVDRTDAASPPPPLPPRDDGEQPIPVPAATKKNNRKSAPSSSGRKLPSKPSASTSAIPSAPAPPPPMPTSASTASLPPPQSGRNDLLASIRNPQNMKKLKKAESRKLPTQAPSSSSSNVSAAPISIQDALKKKFASLNVDDDEEEEWETD